MSDRNRRTQPNVKDQIEETQWGDAATGITPENVADKSNRTGDDETGDRETA